MRRQILLLRLALLLAAAEMPLFADPAPGGTTIPPRPGFTLEDLKAQIPQNNEGAFVMDVGQIMNTATDPEVQKLLTGQPIETTGQLIPEPLDNPDGRRLRIYRAELLCCSAHLRECSVALEFAQDPPVLKPSSWVALTGTLSFRHDGMRNVPVVIVRGIRPIPAPPSSPPPR